MLPETMELNRSIMLPRRPAEGPIMDIMLNVLNSAGSKCERRLMADLG